MEKNRNLHRKLKPMLLPAVLLSVLASCSKQDVLEQQQQPSSGESLAVTMASTTSEIESANLLHKENFEGTPWVGVNTQFATSWGFGVASSPVFEGIKSGRFELRDSDPLNNNGTRAEVAYPKATNLNRWYTFSMYFPSTDWKADPEDECLSQWKQGEHGVSSAISFRSKNDRLGLTVIPSYKASSQKYDLGLIPKDKWVTFVFHIKHSTSSDGVIELWMNGQKVLNRTGSNMYSLSAQTGMTNPLWKFGIYKSAWNGTTSTTVSKRVLYYDDIKVGNENATLTEMTGGTTTTTPPPPTTTNPSPITSFTLVNASTEKDVKTITDGATISLATVGVPKLNIRANGSGFASVKFELSGAQTKTFTDNKAPYALHGDDENGNYYYGNWYPPATGTYTLKATPYSGSNASGTAGTPYTIKFTFVK